MDAKLRNTLESYARRHRLSPSQRSLLQHAATGLTGPDLAAALGASVKELALLELLFNQRTGRSLATAVSELKGIVRHRSRPPSGRVARPVSGVARRPGVEVRRTGTNEDE